jgi:hypothetical protein
VIGDHMPPNKVVWGTRDSSGKLPNILTSNPLVAKVARWGARPAARSIGAPVAPPPCALSPGTAALEHRQHRFDGALWLCSQAGEL